MLLKLRGAALIAAAVAVTWAGQAEAQHVPGTGSKSTPQSDDFEDEEWTYHYNMPKSSREQDENVRAPLGVSTNGKWREGPKRGTPDFVERVKTPAGGIPGSKYSLAIKSKSTGIPGRVTNEQQQDDLLIISRPVPVSWLPSCVVRVHLPEFHEWEKRSGSHFGMRIDLRTTITKEDEKAGTKRGLFGRVIRPTPVETAEAYWPGMFVQFNSKADSNRTQDSAMLVIRGDSRGNVMPGPMVTPGWWTLGISVTADGAVHYFAREGVEDLRPQDLITSQFPYGYRAQSFTTMFFNAVNMDDGKTWSTQFIIDDPAIHYAGGGNQTGAPAQQARGAQGNTRTR